MRNKRWNPALRHTVLGEPGNDRYLGDVRPSSADTRYMNGPFTGPMANALREARNAPEHPVPKSPIPGMSRARYELLVFLRVIPSRSPS